MPCPFPEYNVAIKLSNAYFENIQPQYPFLHEPTFRLHEEKVLRQSSEITDIMLYPIPLFFINMVSRIPRTGREVTTKKEQVYAVGALLTPGYQHLAEVRRSLNCCQAVLLTPLSSYTARHSYTPKSCHSTTSRQYKRSCAMLCTHFDRRMAHPCGTLQLPISTPSSNHGSFNRKLSGIALRQCIELGYHRSTKRIGSNQTPLQVELRKRAFWCAQGIDCTYALRLGRPLGIQLHEIDAEVSL